jgi:hypothetical protein
LGWATFFAAATFAVVAHAVGIFDYGACWHRIYDTPEGWQTWMWNLRESPIPFYLDRFAHSEFQCWQT